MHNMGFWGFGVLGFWVLFGPDRELVQSAGANSHFVQAKNAIGVCFLIRARRRARRRHGGRAAPPRRGLLPHR